MLLKSLSKYGADWRYQFYTVGEAQLKNNTYLGPLETVHDFLREHDPEIGSWCYKSRKSIIRGEKAFLSNISCKQQSFSFHLFAQQCRGKYLEPLF